MFSFCCCAVQLHCYIFDFSIKIYQTSNCKLCRDLALQNSRKTNAHNEFSYKRMKKKQKIPGNYKVRKKSKCLNIL